MKTSDFKPSRRSFLKTSLALPVALAATPAAFARVAVPDEKPAAGGGPLPMRKLGKNGPPVTMLNIGGMMNALSVQYLDVAWAAGIRYFDTADCYMGRKSEGIIADWLAKYPARRSELFLVSKDHPKKGPQDLLEMIDHRLEACGTKYLDAFYIHGLGEKYGNDSVNWPKSEDFKRVADKLKSSGKVKMVGFSCHDARLNEHLNAAAQGGFVDIVMLKYTPFFTKGDEFDRALDACHAKGIALVAMKTLRTTKGISARTPEFDKLHLTTPQAILHAVWSDPRISSICNALENVGQIESSTAAARSYKAPLTAAQIESLKQVVVANAGNTFCPGCPSCNAFAVNSRFAFQDISRYITYYEQDGLLAAREMYRELPPAARDATGIDLAALRDNCAYRVDYPALVRRAESHFA